jgi:hypothetical protein
MNAPKRPGKDRAMRSKEARKAGVSQEKYESMQRDQARRDLLKRYREENRPNVRTRENVMRKKEGSQKTATQKNAGPVSKTKKNILGREVSKSTAKTRNAEGGYTRSKTKVVFDKQGNVVKSKVKSTNYSPSGENFWQNAEVQAYWHYSNQKKVF